MDIFGKKKLEDRIFELESCITKLESEKEQLIRTLERREEAIKKLKNANQEANLALKSVEQKKEAPAGELAKIKFQRDERKPAMIKLVPRELASLIKRLDACNSPEDDLLVSGYANGIPEGLSALPEAERAALSIKSDRGLIAIKYPMLFTILLVPPFPILKDTSVIGSAFQVDWITEMMETPVLVVSAHAGDTFLGVALNKDGFQVAEVIVSQVKEKHSKGGWSQKRFERLREEDIKNHIDLVLDKLRELLAKYRSVVQLAVLSGDQNLLRQIAPEIDLPVIERRLPIHEKKDETELLEEVYAFICYHI